MGEGERWEWERGGVGDRGGVRGGVGGGRARTGGLGAGGVRRGGLGGRSGGDERE